MLVLACGVIGLYFLRFWAKSRDRLFFYFSLSFWILGLNWLALAFARRDEPQTALYAIRLLAFALIMLGIWHKNRVPST
jgi:hypothetical protein